MSNQKNLTVMCPGGLLPTRTCGSSNKAPASDSSKTNEVRYRDKFLKRSSVIGNMAKNDKKYQGILGSIGIMICMECDYHAKEFLNRAGQVGKLLLEGKDEDKDRR